MVRISRFLNVQNPNVVQTIDLDLDKWLDSLTETPAEEFTDVLKHGGWSPVTFQPPQRAAANVRIVAALVLDYDKGATWDAVVKAWTRYMGVVYTTKSHGAGTDGDRLRVVLPLQRVVTSDEYAKLWSWAARVSTDAGCPPDSACKDASRFWYDTTMPPGGWRAVRLSGGMVDPDGILPTIVDEQPRLRVVQPPVAMSSDRRAARASSYLAKIPGAVSGDKGHTQTFNAVAAVMIGFDLDEHTTRALIWNEYNPRCDPPWSEREIEHKLKQVAAKCTRDRGYLLRDRPAITDARSAARMAPPPAAELNVDWATELLTKKGGAPSRTYTNTAIFVRLYPDYCGKWALDTMTKTPWFDGEPIPAGMVHEIRSHIEKRMSYTPPVADVEAAIYAAATERPFHPIKQYLQSLQWDGQLRLREMARDYLGSDSPLHAEMVEKFMIGAARRAIEPGAKLDTALMLVGAQGIGKSTFFAVLGGAWHADSFVDITNKDSFVQIHSAWIYELAELENVVTGKAESRLKAWLTSTHDTFRAPYARSAERHARAVVMCGTTNRGQFITDDTGSRRFWIVPVHQPIDRVLLAEHRDQLWAEAYAAAESGAQWWLSAEADRLREAASDEHREHDEWHDPIAAWLARPDRMEATVGEILEQVIDIKIAFQDRSAQMRVAKVLALLGWDRVREHKHPRRWKYIRTKSQGELL